MKGQYTPKKANFDLYQEVTDSIVQAIEAGIDSTSFTMPWSRVAALPRNAASQKLYRGINVLCLLAAAARKRYDSPEWATYQQWQELGAQVRRGEKSTLVVFWKFRDVETEDSDEEAPAETAASRSRLVCTRGYHVFNAAQVDGYTPKVQQPEPDRDETAEQFFAALGADLRFGGPQAFYSPQGDYIQLPARASFHSTAGYYSVLAHEHTHWTAPAARCDRQLGQRFGDEAYAAEELVAELGAAFLCGQLGLEATPRVDHAQYVANWLAVLKRDKRAIFTAASKAQAAVDWMQARAAAREVAA